MLSNSRTLQKMYNDGNTPLLEEGISGNIVFPGLGVDKKAINAQWSKVISSLHNFVHGITI